MPQRVLLNLQKTKSEEQSEGTLAFWKPFGGLCCHAHNSTDKEKTEKL